MNKEDYFKALKKKQRKNFVFSLKKDADERSKHAEKIQRIENHPRNIMEIEEIADE